jgi:hypothetical protein
MERQASPRLGPRAKRIFLRATPEDSVSALVEVAPSIDQNAFRDKLAAWGGSVRRWPDRSGTVTVALKAEYLSQLADLAGVVFVEAGEAYRPS